MPPETEKEQILSPFFKRLKDLYGGMEPLEGNKNSATRFKKFEDGSRIELTKSSDIDDDPNFIRIEAYPPDQLAGADGCRTFYFEIREKGGLDKVMIPNSATLALTIGGVIVPAKMDENAHLRVVNVDKDAAKAAAGYVADWLNEVTEGKKFIPPPISVSPRF